MKKTFGTNAVSISRDQLSDDFPIYVYAVSSSNSYAERMDRTVRDIDCIAVL